MHDNYESDEDVLLVDSEYVTLGDPSLADDEKIDAVYHENADNQSEDILDDTKTMEIIEQLSNFGYNEKQIISAIQTVQNKQSILCINDVLDEIQSKDQKFYMNEFVIHFISKPYGMNLSTKKKDKNNLYVSKVEKNSFADKNNLMVGAKVIALNGKNVEDIGARKIFELIDDAQFLNLSLSIMFRKKNK